MPSEATTLGLALRRWRAFNRVKQIHAAELFGVAQSTISRWESGSQQMETEERIKVEAIVGANMNASADKVLAGLVAEATRPVHLVCDHTHQLLACSPARAMEFGISASMLMGRSLRRFASDEILMRDEQLEEEGWYDVPVPAPVIMDTGTNRSRLVSIQPSRCRWTRLTLSTGAAARLVETLDPQGIPASQPVRSEKR